MKKKCFYTIQTKRSDEKRNIYAVAVAVTVVKQNQSSKKVELKKDKKC